MMMASWVQKLRGSTVVVKFGGNAMTDDALTHAFCDDIVTLVDAGVRLVVTHGGGPQISSELAASGLASEFRGGLRVTSVDAVHVVRNVLVRIGSELVQSLQSSGASATAVGGHENKVFTARRVGTIVDGVMVDLGRVGEAVTVDTTAILSVLDAGGVPVVSAIGTDVSDGGLLNINADSAASSLAAALAADWLLLLTDVDGLYLDWPHRESLVSLMDTDEVGALLPQLESGMIPKVKAARDAVLSGVGRATILNGRVPHIVVSAPWGTVGTTVTAAGRATNE